jgi:hypothetical protein
VEAETEAEAEAEETSKVDDNSDVCPRDIPGSLASTFVWRVCERFRPSTLVVYVENTAIIRYSVSKDGYHKLSVKPPNAEKRSRAESSRFDIDFQWFCSFVIDSICFVNKRIEIVVAIEEEPDDRNALLTSMAREVQHHKERPLFNVACVTVLLPSQFANTPFSIHTLHRN